MTIIERQQWFMRAIAAASFVVLTQLSTKDAANMNLPEHIVVWLCAICLPVAVMIGGWWTRNLPAKVISAMKILCPVTSGIFMVAIGALFFAFGNIAGWLFVLTTVCMIIFGGRSIPDREN